MRQRGLNGFRCLVVVAWIAGGCSSDADIDAAADRPVPVAETGPLTVVGIGDSFIGWSTVAEQYADLVGAARGVDVGVDKITNQTSNRLEFLRGSDTAQATLAGADIVIVEPQPGPPSSAAFNQYAAGECGGVDNQQCLATSRADFDLYVGELFDEILSLTPDGTVILVTLVGAWAVSAFYPGIEDDPERFRIYVDHVVALQEISARAAVARGFPVVDVTLAFHGPDPYQPAAEELLLPDRAHLTDEGSRVVAELLFEVSPL